MTSILNLCSSSLMVLVAISGSFSWRLRLQKDDKQLEVAKRNHLELKVQELAQKLKINKSIELIEINNLSIGAQAQGVAIFSGRTGIAINPDLVDAIPEDQLEFVIAHELSHIKANDIIWMGIIPSVFGVITTLACSILFPSSGAYFSPLVMGMLMVSSPAAVIGLSVSFIVVAYFSKWREECADKLGLTICSEAAQKAAPHIFDATRISQLEFRNNEEGSCFSKFWRKSLITKDGDARFDIFHPSLKTRIKYLTAYQSSKVN